MTQNFWLLSCHSDRIQNTVLWFHSKFRSKNDSNFITVLSDVPMKDMAIFARNICNQFLSFPPTTLLEPQTRTVVPLCSVFVRPRLEYRSLLWVVFGLDGLHMSFPTWISLWSVEVTVRTTYAITYLKLRTLILRTGSHANAILTHLSLPLFPS